MSDYVRTAATAHEVADAAREAADAAHEAARLAQDAVDLAASHVKFDAECEKRYARAAAAARSERNRVAAEPPAWVRELTKVFGN